MVGSATISMDPDTLEHATTAVEAARSQLEIMKSVATDLDEPFLMNEEKKLNKCEHQLNEEDTKNIQRIFSGCFFMTTVPHTFSMFLQLYIA